MKIRVIPRVSGFTVVTLMSSMVLSSEYQVPSVPLVLVDAHQRLLNIETRASKKAEDRGDKSDQPGAQTQKESMGLQHRQISTMAAEPSTKFVAPAVPLVLADYNIKVDEKKAQLKASEALVKSLPSYVRPEHHKEMTKNLKEIKRAVRSGVATSVVEPGRKGDTSLVKTKSGVPTFNLVTTKIVGKGKAAKNIRINVSEIPALDIGREDRISASVFQLPNLQDQEANYLEAQRLPTTEVFDRKAVESLVHIKPLSIIGVAAIDKKHGKLNKAVTLAQVQAVSYRIGGDHEVVERPISPLSSEDQWLLTALLLYKDGKNCEAVIGLFDKLKVSKDPSVRTEMGFYLGDCAGRLGLLTEQYNNLVPILSVEDTYYTPLAIHSLLQEVPYDQEVRLAQALHSLKNRQLIGDKDNNRAWYYTAKGLFKKGQYKVSEQYASKVRSSALEYDEAQYVASLSQVMNGNISESLKTQEALMARLSKSGVANTQRDQKEVKTLVAINLARTYFEKGAYDKALAYFRTVDATHPLRLATLVELGWAQVNAKDYSGAVGNMHSLHIPRYNLVYQPESHVVRTIGYLNMCQYGDAYKSLRMLEHKYQPWYDKMRSYRSSKTTGGYYGTVRRYLTQANLGAEVDGLPAQVIREMARQKRFLNIQASINRKDTEMHTALSKVEGLIHKKIAIAAKAEAQAKREIRRLKQQLAGGSKANKKDVKVVNRSEIEREIQHYANVSIQQRYLQVVFKESLGQFASYRINVGKRITREIAGLKAEANSELMSTLKEMTANLARFLENNELLKYEVYSGAGENIRYRVAGGKGQAVRVPAAIQEIEKNMNWDFEGEVWSDEVGHFRSNLKNLCPSVNTADGR